MSRLDEDDQREYSEKMRWCRAEVALYLFIVACILYAMLHN